MTATGNYWKLEKEDDVKHLLNPQALGIDARKVKESPFSDLLELYTLVAISSEDGELEKIKRDIVAPLLVIVDYIVANPESPNPSPLSTPRVGPVGAIPDPNLFPPQLLLLLLVLDYLEPCQNLEPASTITMGTDGHISTSSAPPSKRPKT
ncbi:hypothetical protein ACFX2G_046774 [Malus domestica]